MLDHFIQKNIIYGLAFADSLKFSELKPGDTDNKLFTYHLKKVVAAKLVTKNADGSYSLTPEGKRIGKGALKKDSRFLNRAYSILLLAVKRDDGAWLLFRRSTQPLMGLSGFMQTQPLSDQSVFDTAQQALKQKTGLDGEFKFVSSGFFRINKQQALESFIHFTLLTCTNAAGELVQNDELGEYSWEQQPDFNHDSMLPTMPSLVRALESGQPFLEETLSI